MVMRALSILAVSVAGFGGIATGASAATVSVSLDGNDCGKYFAVDGLTDIAGDELNGFNSCQIFVVAGGTQVLLSPVIAKYTGDLALSETNDQVFPEFDGSEISFSNTTAANGTGDWSYTPGLLDPGIRYWAAKASNGFNLFWNVADSDTEAGGACDGTNNYSFDCLSLASVVTSGSWITPLDSKDKPRGLSHITFYDSVDPSIVVDTVPLPAAGWMLVAGLGGLFGMRRRKAAS